MKLNYDMRLKGRGHVLYYFACDFLNVCDYVLYIRSATHTCI